MPVAELVEDLLESFPKGSEAERITLDTTPPDRILKLLPFAPGFAGR